MTESTFHDKMASPAFYERLDPGVRFAIRVLHAHGIDTGQSCQGGEGHSYDRPTIDLGSWSDDGEGFAALHCLHAFGLGVRDLSIHWDIVHGLPTERFWRVTFWKPCPERADEVPMFVWGYQR